MTGYRTLREVLAPNPSPMTLTGTRTYVLGRRRPVVIDPGPDDSRHLERVQALLEGAQPLAILLTHYHPDHAAGAIRLARATGAPVRASPEAARPRQWTPGVIWIQDSDELATDAGTIRAIATPGHAPEHLAFWWRGEEAPGGSAVFVGDLMMGEGDTTLVAAPDGDVRAYLESLDRLEELGASVLYPSHGPDIGDPQAAIRRYRTHRQERIQQVREAVRHHPHADAEELVDLIYRPTLDPRLRPAAAGSVAAVLRYLRDP